MTRLTLRELVCITVVGMGITLFVIIAIGVIAIGACQLGGG